MSHDDKKPDDAEQRKELECAAPQAPLSRRTPSNFMAAAELIEQLHGCSAFFASQSSLLSPEAISQSQKAMTSSLLAQIQNIAKLDAGSAAKLNEALNGSSFDIESKQELASAVAQKTMTSVAAATAGGPRRLQTLCKLQAYLTEEDWATLQDGQRSIARKLQTLVDRLCLLGLQNPTEATIKHIVSVLACAHDLQMTAEVLHSHVIDVKAAIHARAGTVHTSVRLTVFPDDPSELPAELYNAAYSDGDPQCVELPGLASMMARVPLRNTNKSLSGTGACSQHQRGANANNPVQALLQQLLSAAQGNAQREDLLPGLQIIPPAKRPALEPPQQSLQTDLVPGAGSAPRQPQPERADAVGERHTPGHLRLALPGSQAVGIGQARPPPQLALPAQLAAPLPPPQQCAEAHDQGQASDHEDADTTGDADAQNSGSGPGESLVDKLEKLAAGNAAKKLPAKAKGKAQVLKKPSSNIASQLAASKRTKVKLGCAKCRGSHLGCIQCRDPGFNGARWQK